MEAVGSQVHSTLAHTSQAATPTTPGRCLLPQALLSGPLLQPLANLLSDPVERCRVTGLTLLLDVAPLLSGEGPCSG